MKTRFEDPDYQRLRLDATNSSRRIIARLFSHEHQPSMILLEIGNSTIKLAEISGDDAIHVERFADIPAALPRLRTGDRIVCAPVSETEGRRAIAMIGETREVEVIERESLRAFIGTSYDTPETLGLDRVLNLLGLNGDGLVISCGTAITIDAIAGGRPCWGAIMPGFRTAAAGLHDRVPALPLVSIDGEPGIPARSSLTSVTNGILLGTARGAGEIASELAMHAFGGDAPRIVLTGGDAATLARLWRGAPVTIDDALLFRGMLRAIQ